MPWIDDTPPPTPNEIRVEKTGGELKLSWDPQPDETGPYTYTVYYSQQGAINTALPQHILATGIRTTELYLPVSEDIEMGLTFCMTVSTPARIESAPSPEAFYYLSKYIK